MLLFFFLCGGVAHCKVFSLVPSAVVFRKIDGTRVVGDRRR
jgi:hypothetical protein